MKIPNKVRYFNKRFLNRLMMVIAGKKRSPIAAIRHRGRVSGADYATPIITAPSKDGFVFALTYGDHVDWYRNILAAGAGVLEWKGHSYFLVEPVNISADEGWRYFPPPFNRILKATGIEGFFTMRNL
jgi:deazaflavin-dependent oxidoreductase (nitroreductase family)